MGRPEAAELLASGRELADEIGELSVERVAAGLEPKERGDILGRLLPVGEELLGARVEKDEAGEASGGGGEDGNQDAGAPETGTSARSSDPSPPSADQNAGAQNGIPIRIAFGNTELTARLDDNATARDLSAQLPLTLTFRDHNNVEKTASLPRELSLDGAPEGHDPAAGDIGYWAPYGDLVFYYDSEAPFFNGIVRIGEFDGDMDAIERRSEDFSVTIERAG